MIRVELSSYLVKEQSVNVGTTSLLGVCKKMYTYRHVLSINLYTNKLTSHTCKEPIQGTLTRLFTNKFEEEVVATYVTVVFGMFSTFQVTILVPVLQYGSSSKKVEVTEGGVQGKKGCT